MSKYFQPFDQPDNPDASYQNGNLQLGIPGSIPDARGFEQPQRELKNFITDSGFVESATDLRQLGKSIQRGKVSGTADVGSVNAMAITLTPTPDAYHDLMAIRVRVGTANTGATTINMNGLGVRPVLRPNGAPLQGGDLLPGVIVTLIYDDPSDTFLLASLMPLSISGAVAISASAGTFTVPVGVTRLRCRLWAGGGGGGGAIAGGAGGGGGGGGYAEGVLSLVPGTVISYIVGATGAPGAGSGGNGSAGGSTSFGGLLSATGGLGGGGATSTGSGFNGGANGIGSGGISGSGTFGGAGYVSGGQPLAGGGGMGGFGGGGAGASTFSPNGGVAPGGGGGGGAGGNAGGSGGPGYMILEW